MVESISQELSRCPRNNINLSELSSFVDMCSSSIKTVLNELGSHTQFFSLDRTTVVCLIS